jgi:hypothetical protein
MMRHPPRLRLLRSDLRAELCCEYQELRKDWRASLSALGYVLLAIGFFYVAASRTSFSGQEAVWLGALFVLIGFSSLVSGALIAFTAFVLGIFVIPVADSIPGISIEPALAAAYLTAGPLLALVGALVRHRLSEARGLSDALQNARQVEGLIMENSLDLIGIYDCEGRILKVSRSFEELMDYSEAELRAFPPFVLLASEQRAEARAAWKLLIEGSQDAPYQLRMIDRHGHPHLLASQAKPIYDQAGRPVAVVATLRDIGERIEAEARFQRIIETTSDAVFVSDNDQRLTFLNDKARELTGYDVGDIVPEDTDLVHPDDQHHLVEMKHARLQGKGSEAELRMVLPSGRIAWAQILTNPILVEGEPMGAVTYVRDITQRKKQQEALRDLSRQNEALLSSIREGLLSFDTSKQVTFANPAALDMLGFEPVEVQSGLVSLRSIISTPGMIYEAIDQRLTATLVTGEPSASEPGDRFVRSDGETFPVEYIASPLREGREIVGVVLAFHDISDRLEMESRLLEAQKLEAVGRLAGGVAHDFNNALTTIGVAADMISRSLPDPDSLTASQAKAIKQAVDDASLLTKQLLAFSRKQTSIPAVLDVNQIIRDSSEIIRGLFREDVKVKISLTEDAPLIWADSSQLRQVIFNLLLNARDAVAPGGEVEIATSSQEPPGDEHVPGCYLCLKVSDTGQGISASDMAKIFEPFFTTKPEGQGTGLGLSAVYGIIRGFGGTIHVDSEPHEGSRFSIYLPATEASSEGETPDEIVASGQEMPETPKVLYVDDNDGVRLFGTVILQQLGYLVTTSATPSEALQAASEETFDILISDLVMPQMSGIDLAVRLKADNPHLKILITSGQLTGEEEEQTDDMVYVRKPFGSETILAAVERLYSPVKSSS